TVRMVSNVEVFAAAGEGVRMVRSNFLISEFRPDGVRFLSGFNGHRFVADRGRWLIAVRQVNLIDCDQNLGNPSIVIERAGVRCCWRFGPAASAFFDPLCGRFGREAFEATVSAISNPNRAATSLSSSTFAVAVIAFVNEMSSPAPASNSFSSTPRSTNKS